MSEDPDLHFGKLLGAVMKQDKDDYIEALETLIDMFTTHGIIRFIKLPGEHRDKTPIYAATLWQIANLVADRSLCDKDVREAIANVLCGTGHIESSFQLAAEPPTPV